jgi:hypothetical protein
MGDYTFLQQPAIFTFDFGGRRKANVPMCRCDDVPMCRCADVLMCRCANVPMRKTQVPAFGGIICHLSPVICHPSSVIRHPSFVIHLLPQRRDSADKFVIEKVLILRNDKSHHRRR